MNILSYTGIVLLMLTTAVVLHQVQIRNRWKKIRTIQEENRKYTLNELVKKHPYELRDMLTNARSVQTVNAAYLLSPKVREADLELAQKIQAQTETQINILRTAITKSVENRAQHNLITPAHSSRS